MSLRHALTVGLLSIAGIAPAFGQEWTRFRGPNGSGIGDAKANIPAKWSAADFNWKVRLPGEGHSSPVVWGERIYVTATDPQTAARILLCINDKDGSTLWKREFESTPYRQHKENSYASSTPALDEKHIYLVWSTPEEYSLRALTHDGKDVWKMSLGVFKSAHGSGTSPIVYKDMVIVSKDEEGNSSFIAAVDKNTGKERWRSPRTPGKMNSPTPCILSVDGQDQVIVPSMLDGVVALDPSTGSVLWQFKEAQMQRVVGSPALYQDVVISAGGEGGFGRFMHAVRAGTKGRPAELLFRKVQAQNPPYVPSPIVVGDLLFTWTDQGVITCLRPRSGEQVWQEKLPDARVTFFTSLVAVGDRIYCVTKDSSAVYVIRASDKFELLAKNDLGLNELCHATPAIANGKMYIRTFNHLISVGGKTAVAGR